eukprot:PhF_6_TR34697/c0_g1_i1/m.50491/K06109/RAB13; Ras-related protein Rab-13
MDPTFDAGGFDHVFKIIVIGDSGVGKSSLTLRLSEDTFFRDHASTIAIDFRMYCMEYMDKKIRLQIWDTAGQERFQSVATAFYRGANGVILCFDLTSRKSFENVEQWMERVRAQALPGVTCVLVGCKNDMKDAREISREEAEQYAKARGMGYVETSAKDSDNVIIAFEQVVVNILESMREATAKGARIAGSGRGGQPSSVSFSSKDAEGRSSREYSSRQPAKEKKGCC